MPWLDEALEMYLPPVSAAPSAPLCAECSPSGSKKNGCLPQTLHAAVGAERLVNLRDLRRRGDRIADHASAHMAHNFRNRTVAMDDGWEYPDT